MLQLIRRASYTCGYTPITKQPSTAKVFINVFNAKMNRYWVTNHFCVYVESAPEYSTVNQMNILTESSERTFNLALRYALYVAKHELKVKKLQVVVNHTYPRRLFTTLHKKYKDNDFLKANGEPMENANEARLLIDLRKNLFVEIDTRKYNGFFVDGRNVVLDKAIQGDGNSTTSKTKIVADSFFRGVKHVSLTHSYDFCSDLSKEVFQKVIAMANPEKEENNSIDETYYVTVMERQTNKNEKAFVYGFCTEDRKTYKRNKLVNEKAMRTKGVIMGHIQAIESAIENNYKNIVIYTDQYFLLRRFNADWKREDGLIWDSETYFLNLQQLRRKINVIIKPMSLKGNSDTETLTFLLKTLSQFRINTKKIL